MNFIFLRRSKLNDHSKPFLNAAYHNIGGMGSLTPTED